ncbi:MAG: pyridoxamine 5'-phosphate oxidase family protein [Fimbriimonas sp.]
MGKFLRALEPALIRFIQGQHIFFTASAPSDAARVNLSPKGGDSLVVLDNQRIAYYDLPGSGNETANHVEENGRLTLMWCAFDGKPLILRTYLRAEIVRPGQAQFSELLAMHWPDVRPDIVRQVFVGEIEAVQTSCGFGVPFFTYDGERETLSDWAEKKADAGTLENYIEKNAVRNDLKWPVA